jgi:hypothetical protein
MLAVDRLVAHQEAEMTLRDQDVAPPGTVHSGSSCRASEPTMLSDPSSAANAAEPAD